jgi:hypothetical protein
MTRWCPPSGAICGHVFSGQGRFCKKTVVARGGVEPPTFRFSVGRSYQLSYLAVECMSVLLNMRSRRSRAEARGTVATAGS